MFFNFIFSKNKKNTWFFQKITKFHFAPKKVGKLPNASESCSKNHGNLESCLESWKVEWFMKAKLNAWDFWNLVEIFCVCTEKVDSDWGTLKKVEKMVLLLVNEILANWLRSGQLFSDPGQLTQIQPTVFRSGPQKPANRRVAQILRIWNKGGVVHYCGGRLVWTLLILEPAACGVGLHEMFLQSIFKYRYYLLYAMRLWCDNGYRNFARFNEESVEHYSTFRSGNLEITVFLHLSTWEGTTAWSASEESIHNNVQG